MQTKSPAFPAWSCASYARGTPFGFGSPFTWFMQTSIPLRIQDPGAATLVLVVRDLGSKYGTYVDESRVREACLWPGSKLTVGLNSFFVCYSLPERGAGAAKEADQGKAEKEAAGQEESDSAKEFSSGPGIDIVGLPEV